MIKKTLAAASLSLLLVSCGFTAPNTNLSSSKTPSATYSREMVAAHNTSSDCWAIINGKVYNLTDWEDQHPGGKEAILSNCGKDISNLSSSHPGGDFGGEDLQKILTQFYKGDIE